ncbi:MAG: ABC transporter permease [Chloroflexi bacterium]|nr:ABC transporter permease [Chloroflexota bacterium]
MLSIADRPALEGQANERPARPGSQIKRTSGLHLPHAGLATAIRRLVFYAVLVALWELLARSGLWPSYLLPGPMDAFGALASGFRKDLYVEGMLVSLKNVAIGYGLSVGIGVSLGVLIGRHRLLEETIGSLVMGLQALPSVCWLPLAILWIGLNERAVIFVVLMGAVFSITLGVDAGVKNTPPLYVKAARNLGAHGLGLYWQVVLPAALPAILGGLKQGWSFAWRSLMAGELLFYSLSLGNLLQTGRDLNDVAMVMSVMALIVFIGVAVDRLAFAPLERRVRGRWGYDVNK